MTKEEIYNWFVDFLGQRAKKNKKVHSIETFDGGVLFKYNQTEYLINIFDADEIVFGPMGYGDFNILDSVWETYEVRVEENFQEEFEEYFDNDVVQDKFKFADKLWKVLEKYQEDAETHGTDSFFYDLIGQFIEINN